MPFVAVLVAGLAIPREAFAHLVLVSSAPPAGSTLDAAPTAIGLSFSEDPQLGATHIDVVNAAGARVNSGAPRLVQIPKHTLEIGLSASLAPGRYTVRWRTTSDDGHPVHGAFTFRIAERAAVAPTTVRVAAPDTESHATDSMAMDTSEAQSFDVGSPLYVAIRWLGFVAMLALVGAVVLARWITPRAAAGRPDLARRVSTQAAAVLRVAAALLVIHAACRLAAQVAALRGNPPMPVDVRGILTTTVWGWAWLFEVAGAIVAMAAAVKGDAARWRIAGAAALVLALSFSFSGHAASATHLRVLAVSSDALHILAAGSWLGTLLSVAIVAMPACLAQPDAERGAAAADFINAFSPVALVSAAVVGITGVVAAWLHLGSWHAFVASDYGRTLLIKLARSRGIPVIGGLEMFVQQGARQFEIWTGKPAPETEMYRVVEMALRRQVS